MAGEIHVALQSQGTRMWANVGLLTSLGEESKWQPQREQHPPG